MEHPGVDINQVKKDLTLEEIQVKIGELNTRLTFAYRTNNESLMNQVNMVLEVYTRAQREMLHEMFSPGGDDPDIDGKIDVS